MIKQGWAGLLILGLTLSVISLFYLTTNIDISPDLADKLGHQIWCNECKGTIEGLTCWNEGEEFASLGIGHFIWYPENQPVVFKQSFPSLLLFFKEKGVELPNWLIDAKGCPWKSGIEFQQAQDSVEMKELRQLLAEHVDLQVMFMVERLYRVLPNITQKHSYWKRQHIAFQFYRLAQTPQGLYALLDYLNFKGEGVFPHERYRGEGWGLLQVLDRMSGNEYGKVAVEEFVATTKSVLRRRVENAPPERKEQRWLKGWYNRLEGYLQWSI